MLFKILLKVHKNDTSFIIILERFKDVRKTVEATHELPLSQTLDKF